jgi:hypothetical protein
MYRHIAEEPQGEFHFEMGRTLAERAASSRFGVKSLSLLAFKA